MWHKKVQSVSDRKMIIALADPEVLLNKRTELISKCQHRSKFTLNSVK